jgi:ferrous iron transport protein B
MGLGCNSVGVTGCRIIESRRERTLAVLTNSLTPCNGRLPTIAVLIALLLVGGVEGGLACALWMLLALLLSMGMTLFCTALLSRTLYRGAQSSCLLELPPFRRPRIRTVLRCAVLDRTVRILCRAVVVSVPAGMLLWLGTHVYVGGQHLLWYLCEGLAPVGRLLGMDGAILAAFLLALPANELFLPILIMLYQGGASMVQIGSYEALGALLTANGWTLLTALCTLFFVLFHWPCATTLLTVYKETRSVKTTLLAVVVPSVCGILLCAVTCLAANLLMRLGAFK